MVGETKLNNLEELKNLQTVVDLEEIQSFRNKYKCTTMGFYTDVNNKLGLHISFDSPEGFIDFLQGTDYESVNYECEIYNSMDWVANKKVKFVSLKGVVNSETLNRCTFEVYCLLSKIKNLPESEIKTFVLEQINGPE